ncbi:MAG TPA: NnrU family protein [Candidatus Binataceae bacterium]
MDPVVAIAFWAFLFLATHLAIASRGVRPRLVGALGEQRYRGLYSLVGFATLVPLVITFAYHKHSGPMLWYLRIDRPIRWLAWAMMMASFILIVASFINPSPASVGAQTRQSEPRGMLKITRHPALTGLAIFGLAHVLTNGWLGDVIFFGMFPVLAIVGAMHQDSRKLREIGEPYREFMAKTSIIPFGALIQGRQHWKSSDMPWMAIAAGATVTVAVLALHPWIFGGNPLG